MKYVANPSFSKLGRENNHQGLDKPVFDLLKDGQAVECTPPEWLVRQRFLKLVEDETDTTSTRVDTNPETVVEQTENETDTTDETNAPEGTV